MREKLRDPSNYVLEDSKRNGPGENLRLVIQVLRALDLKGKSGYADPTTFVRVKLMELDNVNGDLQTPLGTDARTRDQRGTNEPVWNEKLEEFTIPHDGYENLYFLFEV